METRTTDLAGPPVQRQLLEFGGHDCGEWSVGAKNMSGHLRIVQIYGGIVYCQGCGFTSWADDLALEMSLEDDEREIAQANADSRRQSQANALLNDGD